MTEIWQRAKLRLAYLGIGLVIGVLAGGVPGALIYKNTVKQYEERFELYATMTAQSVRTAAEMREENERLRTRTVEKVNADGSKETITETSKDLIKQTEKNESSVDQIESSTQQNSTIVEKSSEERKYRQSGYYLGLGLNQHGSKHLMFSYPIWSKLNGHAWVDEDYKFGIGLGIVF